MAELRIGISFNPEAGTGITRYSRNLLVALGRKVQEEQSFQFVGFSFCKRDPRPAWLPETIHYQTIAIPGQVQNKLHRSLHVSVEKICRLGNINALHTTDLFLAHTRLPRIITVHDVVWRHSAQYAKGVVSSKWIQEAEEVIRKADHICADSNMTAQDLIAGGVPSKKITIAHLGVDERFGAASSEEGERVRQKYTLPSEFILYVGSINTRKNLPCLVSALESMSKPPMLVLAGPIPSEGLDFWGLNRIAYNHLGFLVDEDVPGLYAAAKILVFPSLSEGFGLPLIEAMAAGTPVVASNIAVFSELAGDAPYYFNPLDVAELRVAIEVVMSDNDLALQMQEKGRLRSSSFSWEACAEATLAAYHIALDGK